MTLQEDLEALFDPRLVIDLLTDPTGPEMQEVGAIFPDAYGRSLVCSSPINSAQLDFFHDAGTYHDVPLKQAPSRAFTTTRIPRTQLVRALLKVALDGPADAINYLSLVPHVGLIPGPEARVAVLAFALYDAVTTSNHTQYRYTVQGAVAELADLCDQIGDTTVAVQLRAVLRERQGQLDKLAFVEQPELATYQTLVVPAARLAQGVVEDWFGQDSASGEPRTMGMARDRQLNQLVIVLGPALLMDDPNVMLVAWTEEAAFDPDACSLSYAHTRDLDFTEFKPVTYEQLAACGLFGADPGHSRLFLFEILWWLAQCPSTAPGIAAARATTLVMLAAETEHGMPASKGKALLREAKDLMRSAPKEDVSRLRAAVPSLVQPNKPLTLSTSQFKKLVAMGPVQILGTLINLHHSAEGASPASEDAKEPVQPTSGQDWRKWPVQTPEPPDLQAYRWMLTGGAATLAEAETTLLAAVAHATDSHWLTQISGGFSDDTTSSGRITCLYFPSSLLAIQLQWPSSQVPARLDWAELSLEANATGQARLELCTNTEPEPWITGIIATLARKHGLHLDAPEQLLWLDVSNEPAWFQLRELLENFDRPAPVIICSHATPAAQSEPWIGRALVVTLQAAHLKQYEKAYKRLELGTVHVFNPYSTAPRVEQVACLTDMLPPQLAGEVEQGTGFASLLAGVMARLIEASKAQGNDPAQSAELEARLAELTQQHRVATTALSTAREANTRLLDKVAELKGNRPQPTLQHAPNAATPLQSPPTDFTSCYPATLAELPVWSQRLAPRVTIADKALRYAAKQQHNEAALIYEILERLGSDYWESRWGQDTGANLRWRDFLKSRRLRNGQIGTAPLQSTYASEYTATFPQGRHTMTLHVQGSSSRQKERGLRIYYHPDDTTRTVLVGALPHHLQNTLS